MARRKVNTVQVEEVQVAEVAEVAQVAEVERKSTRGRVKKVISGAERETWNHVIVDCTTKSAQIRALAMHGVARADIARFLGIRYQHVRNVLVTPVSEAQK